MDVLDPTPPTGHAGASTAALPQNDAFCILPWTSVHIATHGTVMPCCIAMGDVPLGSMRTQTLEEIWNGKPMRELRLDMLAGRRSHTCERCYEQEASGFYSLRRVAAELFGNHAPEIAETAADGSLAHMRIGYLDIRFSNVCNFQCRTCGPAFSTAWARYAKGTPYGVLRPKNTAALLMDELRPLLDHMEQIYFAGGEPALIQEHYELLETLIAMGRTDVRLSYATNLSILRFKQWDLLELWRQFPNVALSASLDGSGPRGEYLRKGQQWDRTVENRRLQMKECPHVTFTVTSTLSNLNSLHLPDFHEEWMASGLIQPHEVHLNILQSPPQYRLTTMPPSLKHRVRDRYNAHIALLSAKAGCQHVIDEYASAIRFMESQDTTESLEELRREVGEQDRLRGESLRETFPELSDLLDPA